MRISLFRRTAPDPDRITIAYGGDQFEVAVRRRPAARRFTLRVSQATGEIALTVPQPSDFRAAIRFVEAHGAWIAQRVQRVPRRIAFRPGVRMPLRGIPHRIVRRAELGAAVLATRDEIGAPVIAVSGESEHVPRRVADFLKQQATRDLDGSVAKYTALLGIPARRITIRDTKSRWGSCSAAGRLSFSWRLIMAPPYVLDYLAAHEVAHLKEMNHSVRFWRLLMSLCPRTEEAEAWLKAHGAELHRYG
ncbi:M48 family metallopeptidase [Chelatococcus reniformis]|uniref:Metal-dependent hydrolase n=1 Tax=Chelatococcus reniformis TaxID=1494448 RepID=A0A916XKX1_9HYPH|nr:SprT family zinc-dependent metalloprotease [Chelatococcus reniformis]GGC79660.1 metal-dependent hydrolase [Chelatococcus reniformis]